jgi:dCMP deaminase
MGFNGLPRGIADTYERLNDRELKLQLIVHAEMNALLNAVRVGISVRDCTMYLAAVDASGLVWGGAPCVRCAVEIIQSGISGIVAPPFKNAPSHWTESVIQAKELLYEAGVTIREVDV